MALPTGLGGSRGVSVRRELWRFVTRWLWREHGSATDDHSFHTRHIRSKLPVIEELAAAGTLAQLGDPVEIAVWHGPKKRA